VFAIRRFVTACVVLAACAFCLEARAAQFELATATIADIQGAIDAGALSSEKLVGLYLKRIEAYDKAGPRINAVLYLNKNALAEARALDAERKSKGRRSPLHGIPVVIKDLIDVAGFPTTSGFKPFGAPVPPRDAAVTARLKAAGAIVLAKVNTVNWFGKGGFDELHPIGATLNPYNVGHSPGGSSNGTGASIAAWFATVGLGTDTGGSVQIPSSYNSLVGMVATQGLVSRAGIVPRGPTQDRAGPMARSVYDAATLLSVIAGWDVEDLGTVAGLGHFPQGDWAASLGKPSLEGKRIGVLREMFSTGPKDAEVTALFDQALADMKQGGALILDPVLTGTNLRDATSSAISGTTHPYELIPAANAYLERLGPNRPFKKIEDMFKAAGLDKIHDRYIRAMTLPSPDKSPDYLARFALKDALRDAVTELMQKFDLDAVVLPYRSLPPPAGSDTSAPDDTNTLTSTTGLPAVIMPGGYTKDNLPVGIQFVSKPFDDLVLLQVAQGYEQASKRRKSPAITPALAGETFSY
jgi:Asp-tRNA(Asn)/Glu-tRNA(Gln) amidotransferase A subunit family amidase